MAGFNPKGMELKIRTMIKNANHTNPMKKLFILFTCILVLLSCINAKQDTLFNDVDKNFAIATLRQYQNVNSQLTAERNAFYLLMLEQSSAEEPSEADKSYFIRNIAHIDSVVIHGVALINKNKGKELLTMLEAELINFYAHPHNTAENEIALHRLLIDLYFNDTTLSKEEYYGKVIELYEWNKTHFESLENIPADYINILLNLYFSYLVIEEYDHAIIVGEKMSEYVMETGNKEKHACATTLLGEAYGKAGKPELEDSCYNSIEHLPYHTPESPREIFELMNR